MNKIKYILNEKLYQNMTAEEMYSIATEYFDNSEVSEEEKVKFLTIAIDNDPEESDTSDGLTSEELAIAWLYHDIY